MTMDETINELKEMIIEDLSKPCNKDLVLVIGGVKFDRESLNLDCE